MDVRSGEMDAPIGKFLNSIKLSLEVFVKMVNKLDNMNYSFKKEISCFGYPECYGKNLFMIGEDHINIGDDDIEEYITSLVKLDEELNEIWISEPVEEDSFRIVGDIILHKTSKKRFNAYHIADMSLLYSVEMDCENYGFLVDPYQLDIYYVMTYDHISIYDRQTGAPLKKCNAIDGAIYEVLENGFIVDDFNGYCLLYDKETLEVVWKYSFEENFSKEPEWKDSVPSFMKCWQWKDKIIISTHWGTVCLSQKEGAEIWKNEFSIRFIDLTNSYRIEDVNLTLCVSSYKPYYICLEDGVIYNNTFFSLSAPDNDFELLDNGKRYKFEKVHDIIFHDSLYWFHSVNTCTDKETIVAIDFVNGKYKHIIPTNISRYDMILGLIFFADKMLIVTGGEMLIYEEQPK